MVNSNKTPFINAHTHTFTKDHTPKHMAKQILPWPFYKWLATGFMVNRIKKYLNRNQGSFHYSGRNKIWNAYKRKKFWTTTPVVTFFYRAFLTLVWIIFAYYLLGLIKPLVSDTWVGTLAEWSKGLTNYIPSWFEDFIKRNYWNQIGLLLLIILAFKNVRNSLKSYLGLKIQKAMGKERLEFLLRYINIVRFTSKQGQAYIFNDLEQQYPKGTKFVVLPMDMEYMDAGPVEKSFPEQMEEVLKLKDNNKETCYPFVMVDPRRIDQQSDANEFLNLNTKDPNAIVLEDCLMKDYMDGGCTGIKLYPALGYYVFDKALLPLWLYCAQNNIPITTHCSIGPVYYRGKLKDLGENYDLHPIFEEVYHKDENEDEVLGKFRYLEHKNKDFQKNFTHPLNYLCLIHKPLLIKVIEEFDEDDDLKTLFGYENGDIARDLSQLKINLAHYGSAEMWEKFLSQDRYRAANAIIKNPTKGLDLVKNIQSKAKLYQYWHYVDWFSIISTMMMQFDNLYTDVSYTAHDLKYLSLLSEILDHPKISKRVLFGTDFYVVSNHKTEKQYWIDMQNSLGEEKWNKIARENPTRFLTSKLPGTI